MESYNATSRKVAVDLIDQASLCVRSCDGFSFIDIYKFKLPIRNVHLTFNLYQRRQESCIEG